MEEKRILIAVCDTLRKGGSQYRSVLLDAKNDTEYLGVYFSEPIYDIYHIHKNSVGLVVNGSTSIKFEVYEINESEIDNIDYNYDIGLYDMFQYSTDFERRKIKTSYGDAYTYFWTGNIKIKPKIDSGDYIEYDQAIHKTY